MGQAHPAPSWLWPLRVAGLIFFYFFPVTFTLLSFYLFGLFNWNVYRGTSSLLAPRASFPLHQRRFIYHGLFCLFHMGSFTQGFHTPEVSVEKLSVLQDSGFFWQIQFDFHFPAFLVRIPTSPSISTVMLLPSPGHFCCRSCWCPREKTSFKIFYESLILDKRDKIQPWGAWLSKSMPLP